MTVGLGLAAYIDVPGFLRAPSGQETASLLGLNTTTGGGATQPAGTTSLPVAASAGWAAGLAWVLDGPFSEVVSVTGSADGTHLTLAAPGTAFAHAPGVSVSQAGSAGALAEVLLRASAFIDGYCRQGASGSDRCLFAVARTERWAMPSVRAHIDRDQVIVVAPGHFPVQSVASLAIEFGQGQSLALDVSQVEEQAPGRLVEVPYLLLGGPTVGQQLLLETVSLSRSRRQWAVLTYTGGIPYSGYASVPWDVQQAAVWVASDLLSQRYNPTGAAELTIGKIQRIQRQRGDATGDSILIMRARDVLEPYRAEGYA